MQLRKREIIGLGSLLAFRARGRGLRRVVEPLNFQPKNLANDTVIHTVLWTKQNGAYALMVHSFSLGVYLP
ncbi:hypothetical protein O6P43_018839 [Quillaja saponaria]|uniref:Uncharacterized protein n=1 Tax=Quillaja saponaria TaxID=32244 RepID=A0AAD7LHK5_QUISA|nr:hypothetical protein O6P43_018839 [Quillaja saponaria]